MQRHSKRAALIIGAMVFVAAVAILVLLRSDRFMTATGVAFVVVMIAKHVALVAAVGTPVLAGVRQRHGITLHSPRLYDVIVRVYCLGRESRLRARTLDAARVAAGDHVLDVCCGTGTLALAAQRRVGASGSVRGVDMSPEMVARAQAKAARAGQAVGFEVASAAALPFADQAFDVVMCSLALHHLDRDTRECAIAEMHRVVKPGGRVAVVEFGARASLHMRIMPAARRHAVDTGHLVDEAVATMTRTGLEHAAASQLGFAGLLVACGQRAGA